ncbi:MAG TPA: LuxR C-terminal-related transcriptional regulator, partial [Chloroflexota bacterium]|nr:LuxR C-terminal-related transcriptional regulator [Chloroflexota bacterium]
ILPVATMPLPSDPAPVGPLWPFSAPPSQLIGRKHEAALAVALLQREHTRLLTLTGPGGVGKTRLALEVARELAPAFTDGARFIPLAVASRGDLVASTILRGLAFENTGSDARTTLLHRLGDRHLLLVLDNLEHVLDAAPLVVDLLQACPRLKVLATSRELLRVTGEHALPVPPLTLPTEGNASPDEVAGSSAVQLFVDRAQSINPTFALTATNAPVVAAICRRLDGLPLAIELAATQIGVLPPAALLARIAQRLSMPVPGPRDAPARHRTMRSTIAWSYEILPPDEQRLFRYLGAFTGGFGLDAVETVCHAVGGPWEETPDRLGVLAALVTKSLVRQVEENGEPRFSMLETIRGFAFDMLDEHGERARVADAHAAWCLALAEDAAPAPHRPDGNVQLSLLELEHPNLGAALEWLWEQNDASRLLRLVIALSGFWYAHGHYREGTAWIERALANAPRTLERERAPALVGLARFRLLQGDFASAGDLLAQGVSVLRNTGDVATLVLALILQGATAVSLGESGRAETLLDEALDLVGTIGDPAVASALTAQATANLGVAAHARGDLKQAATRHHLALRTAKEHADVLGVVRSLRDLGDVARDQGDYAGSVALYQESLALRGDQGDLRVLLDILEGTALAAAAWNQPERAARLLGAAERLAVYSGALVAMGTRDQAAHDRAESAVRAALPASRLEAAWTSGRLLTVREAVADVLALCPPTPASNDVVGRAGIRLVPREREVLELLATGAPDQEIASSLFLSVRTVEGHVSHIRAKLGVRTRTAAVAVAIAAGLIDAPSKD